MSCEHDVLRMLRQAGRRCTGPRLRVASVLRHADSHRSAEEIHGLLAESDPGTAIALSTVYRTLETLKELRLVSETDAGPHATYEWIDRAQPHYHLTCRACGTEERLDPGVLDRFARQIRASVDFEPHLDHLAISGLCASCRTTARPPGRSPQQARRTHRA